MVDLKAIRYYRQALIRAGAVSNPRQTEPVLIAFTMDSLRRSSRIATYPAHVALTRIENPVERFVRTQGAQQGECADLRSWNCIV
jgi:hypothetical protein